jgi:chemotaxis protein CheZ
MARLQARRFRIEVGEGCQTTHFPVSGNPGSSTQLDQVLDAINDLRKAMEPQKELSSDVISNFKRELHEAKKLRVEIDEIYQAIDQTKREIATIHEGSISGDRMTTVTGELDQIVAGTEQATEAILSAAEDIEANAADLSASLDGSEHDLANDIREKVVLLFEACNFQDLTGQRITKVVNTLKFIEDRIERMMSIWGGIDAFSEIEADLPEREGDAALLHGPGHADDPDRIAQDDIDALFD